MEVFTPNDVSTPCACGGRTCRTPSILTKHQTTKKHTTWEFQSLCLEFLAVETRQDKVRCLLRMRDLLRTGRVK